MNMEKQWQLNAMEVGLSYAQQHAMWILHIHDGLTLTELGNIAMWNKSTTSALITKLETKGFIRKESENDGTRGFRVFLTEEGRRKLTESVKTENCIDFMQIFKDEDEEKLKSFLNELTEVCNRVGNKYHPDKQEDFNTYLKDYSNSLLEK